MKYNKKVKYDVEEILMLVNDFTEEKGISPTHCYYNPVFVDVDHMYREYECLAKYSSSVNQNMLGITVFHVYGVNFIEDVTLSDQLNIVAINVIE